MARPILRESSEGVELETGPDPVATVIWLHGLGADGHDFVPLVPALGLRAAVRFVFPHAPMRPVTINGGMVMRAWYDILALDGPRREDADGIRASAARVDALVAQEVARGGPSSRVVLAGFSQGGAITLHAGIRHAMALGGLLALSTYLPLAASAPVEASAAGRTASVFMAHGTQDALIPLARAHASRDALQALGCRVEYREYPMGHTVSEDEVRAIAAWLAPRLA